MLTLRNVSIKTREPILTDVNCDFVPGKIYLLTAVNGSGKTTLFRALTNLISVQKGEILYQQKRFEQIKNQVFFFESSEWFDRNLTGTDYLKLVKKTYQSNKSIDQEINRWHLDSFVKMPIKKYSLGMKQRLLIALYAVSDAKYLFMDEITNGLDEEHRNIFFDYIQEAAHMEHKLVIVSTHYQAENLRIADYQLQIKHNHLTEVD